MTSQHETITVLPSPRRLIEALRDVGYDFVGAVADLVDNSVAAHATRVEITAKWDGPESWLRIVDNGRGMVDREITEALRFGSERGYRPDDLGKFGLGLKTASLSQCRRICVASRSLAAGAGVQVRRFDLDRIVSEDKWEIEALPLGASPEELTTPLANGSGTVVLWAQLDRVTGRPLRSSERSERAFWDLVERLEQHLSMVFHRFLEDAATTPSRKGLSILINTREILPWNPFAPEEPATQHLQAKELEVAENGVAGVVTFDPWVLPAKEQFLSDDAFQRLSGPLKWNQQQGFYIYRANRMVQSGGWARMRAPDEHSKLARVALDFFPELDAAFGINIAKMRINLPASLRERLKEPVEALVRVAKKAYSAPKPARAAVQQSIQAVTVAVVPAAKPPSSALQQLNNERAQPAFQGTWPPPPLNSGPSIRSALETAAKATGDSDALRRILDRLGEDAPAVARALA